MVFIPASAVPPRQAYSHSTSVGKRIGFPRRPLELLTLTVVVEQRALRRYQEHLKRDGVSPRTLELLHAVSKDEGWHIDWIRKKAHEVAEEQGTPERYDELLAQYRDVDREVMEEIDEAERRWIAAAA